MPATILAFCGTVGTNAKNGAISVDSAVTWTLEMMPLHSNGTATQWVRGAWAKGLGLFCVVAAVQGNNLNGIATSPDGITWTGQSNGPASGLNDICWNGSIFCAVGNNTVWTSPDGITWTNQTSPEANNWSGVAWSPSLGLFVMVAPAGTHQVATSPNGITWTNQTGSTTGCTTIAWDPVLAIFCAIGATSGHTSTSSNGTAWTDNNGSAGLSSYTYYDIASNGAGSFMVCGGNSGQVAISANGTTTWTRTNGLIGGSSKMNMIIWSASASLWVVVGGFGVATAPSAGTSWTTQTIASQDWCGLVEGIPKSPPTFGSMVA